MQFPATLVVVGRGRNANGSSTLSESSDALFMVVLAHSFPLAVQASVLGEWGYSALFVVSGYVLSYGKAELSIQMARRYVRLYFPMYTAFAFAWLLLQCYSYSEADLGTRMGWFAEIGHLHVFVPGWYPNLVTWTMPYELYAPLVVAVLKGARARPTRHKVGAYNDGAHSHFRHHLQRHHVWVHGLRSGNTG